jgi:predicted DsbA family dithiol-disulfide isomerase
VGDGKFLPLPLFGLAGFVLLFAASLASRRATQLAAAVGGVVAAFLLYQQAFVLRTFCWLCVTTDLSALVAAGAAFMLRPSVWEEELHARLRPWAWWGLGALAVLAPLTWPGVKAAPPVPAGVLALYQPGKLNVVEFADFQCPACRRFSGILKEALASYGSRVHFVRLNKPLDMHQYARDAAHAAVCAEAQHKAEPMADALFAADDLTPAGIDKIAASLGLDAKEFESCVLDPKTEARVERESALLVPPELEGLPTTYIGGKRLLGVQSPEVVADALERAARGEGATGISGYVYLPMVAMLGLLLVRFGLRRDARVT